MAEQRGGDEKDLKVGGGGESIADEDVKKPDRNKLKDLIEFFTSIFGSRNSENENVPTDFTGSIGSSSSLNFWFGCLRTLEKVRNLDFGRDTNRLDYFSVTPFDVFGDQNASSGGGGGGGGGGRTRQLPLVIFANEVSGEDDDGGEVGLQQQTGTFVDACDSFELKLDTVLQQEVSTSSPTTNSIPSIQDCMMIVSIFPGFEPGSDFYNKALHVFWKKEARESFMIPPTNETKLGFLRSLMNANI